MVNNINQDQRQRFHEQRQHKRLETFNLSLPIIYRSFYLGKYPRPDLAEKLFKEWQWGDEESDNDYSDSPFCDCNKPGLILFGSPRSGKTQLACELVRRKIVEKFNFADVRFISAVQWAAETTAKAKRCDLDDWTLSKVRFAWRDDVDPGIIILDDLDKIRVSPSVQSELFNFIETITANEVWLVVTTNVSSRELAKKFDPEFGPAIVARLQEFCVPVNFDKYPMRKPPEIKKESLSKTNSS